MGLKWPNKGWPVQQQSLVFILSANNVLLPLLLTRAMTASEPPSFKLWLKTLKIASLPIIIPTPSQPLPAPSSRESQQSSINSEPERSSNNTDMKWDRQA